MHMHVCPVSIVMSLSHTNNDPAYPRARLAVVMYKGNVFPGLFTSCFFSNLIGQGANPAIHVKFGQQENVAVIHHYEVFFCCAFFWRSLFYFFVCTLVCKSRAITPTCAKTETKALYTRAKKKSSSPRDFLKMLCKRFCSFFFAGYCR